MAILSDATAGNERFWIKAEDVVRLSGAADPVTGTVVNSGGWLASDGGEGHSGDPAEPVNKNETFRVCFL